MIMHELNGENNPMENAFSQLLFSRSGQVQLDLFVADGVKITLLDTLWLAIAYGRMNKRTDGIESMFDVKRSRRMIYEESQF